MELKGIGFDEIVLEMQEGLISDSLTIRTNGKSKAYPNDPRTWKMLYCFETDCGIHVQVEKKKYDGTIEKFPWVGSPSYNYRFKGGRM